MQLSSILDSYKSNDENNGKIYIALSFDNKKEKIKQRLALGIDLGIRRSAATSDGRLIIDKNFNERKRKLRHLKDILKTKGTKSARRKLRYKLKLLSLR